MSDPLATRFSSAAGRYEELASIQKQAAQQFDAWLAGFVLAPPSRIAEIGCGTGFFTQLLHARYPEAYLHATDLAPNMVEHCRAGFATDPKLQFSVADGRTIEFSPTPDWIVSTMCFQWFNPLQAALQTHFANSSVLGFSVMLDGSFSAWRDAHAQLQLTAGLHACPDYAAVLQACADLKPQRLHAQRITLNEWHANGQSFIHSLRAIGADQPHPTHQPVNLRPVLRQLEQGITVNYDIGFFCLEK